MNVETLQTLARSVVAQNLAAAGGLALAESGFSAQTLLAHLLKAHPDKAREFANALRMVKSSPQLVVGQAVKHRPTGVRGAVGEIGDGWIRVIAYNQGGEFIWPVEEIEAAGELDAQEIPRHERQGGYPGEAASLEASAKANLFSSQEGMRALAKGIRLSAPPADMGFEKVAPEPRAFLPGARLLHRRSGRHAHFIQAANSTHSTVRFEDGAIAVIPSHELDDGDDAHTTIIGGGGMASSPSDTAANNVPMEPGARRNLVGSSWDHGKAAAWYGSPEGMRAALAKSFTRAPRAPQFPESPPAPRANSSPEADAAWEAGCRAALPKAVRGWLGKSSRPFEPGDIVRAKSGKTGTVSHRQGHWLHIKFPDGSRAYHDASELERAEPGVRALGRALVKSFSPEELVYQQYGRRPVGRRELARRWY